MITLEAKIRKEKGKKIKKLRQKDVVPAVLYGPGIENLNLQVDLKEFEKALKEAGESSLINLKIEKKEYHVLIQELQKDPISEKPIHVDFYQPSLKEKVQVKVPLIFEGEAPAVKELKGTLVKNISELEIRTFPQNLPREIKVKIDSLKSFEDKIFIKDLILPPGIEVLKSLEEIVVAVLPPEKVEEELVKPIEEKIEEVERVKEEKKEEEVTEEEK